MHNLLASYSRVYIKKKSVIKQ